MSSSFSELTAPQIEALDLIAATIRGLSIDAVEAAQSGHPGLPLGAAQLGAYLYGYFLDHYPKAPLWFARDRFILSAGHGSMLLYSCLHLSGFDLPLEELQHFRKLHSKTPGHPEYRHTPGVETTTGPLGQGLAAAVGQAIGLKMSAAHLELDRSLMSPKVVVLAGDGCMMEGISHEACALAGHLKLDNLVLLYDANAVCLDGPLSECASEEVASRFEGYGWHVLTVDGHNWASIHAALAPLRHEQSRPTLLIAHTTIGFGSPNKQGRHEVHGSPLGAEEARRTKQALGLNDQPFYVPKEVRDYFEQRLAAQRLRYLKWLDQWQVWKEHNPERAAGYEQHLTKHLPSDLEQSLWQLPMPASAATRASSGHCIQYLCERLPWIVGGSADLSCSDNTWIKTASLVSADNWRGRNIKFGVREFAMAAAATGIYQSGGWLPFVGTFLTFSDYMRNAVRLSAMMGIHLVYQFTHDSIFLGEDGPTHQPIEQLASLRAIPGLQVIRPADAHEVAMAWLAALLYRGPTALILSRQALPTLEATRKAYGEGMAKGAYVLFEPEQLDWVLLASGSEVALALELAQELHRRGVGARVVSMPCHRLFDAQSREYHEQVLGPVGTHRLSLEAATTFGWHKYLGDKGVAIGIDTFGQSAPFADLKKLFGFEVEALLTRLGYLGSGS